jgi:hypothetical protein
MPKNLESNESLFQWITMFYSIYRQFIEDRISPRQNLTVSFEQPFSEMFMISFLYKKVRLQS